MPRYDRQASELTRSVVNGILGKIVGTTHPIHHFDGNFSNNANNNLVACQDQRYHSLIHRRTKAYFACGHANWRRCSYCGEYDSVYNLYINGKNCYHTNCKRERRRSTRIKQGEKK